MIDIWEQGYVRIDYYRLVTEWLIIAAITGAVFLIAGMKKRPKPKEE